MGTYYYLCLIFLWLLHSLLDNIPRWYIVNIWASLTLIISLSEMLKFSKKKKISEKKISERKLRIQWKNLRTYHLWKWNPQKLIIIQHTCVKVANVLWYHIASTHGGPPPHVHNRVHLWKFIWKRHIVCPLPKHPILWVVSFHVNELLDTWVNTLIMHLKWKLA